MKYSIIYADPPWPNSGGKRAGKGKAGKHYNLMSAQDILNLPVKRISADNCALFLWTSFVHVDLALKVIQSWGFQYRTCAFVWVKLNPKLKTPCIGLGNYTRSNAEICLLGIKGKLERKSKSVQQIIMSERGKHSEKPKEVSERIVQLFGDLPRVELFARKPNLGWDVWGNELSPKDVTSVFAQH